MNSAKVAVRCTVDFLPVTDEFDVVVALRDENERWYGCREQRFADLQGALRWVEQIYPAMVTIWQADQNTTPQKEDPSETERLGRTVVFLPPWLDEQERRDELEKQLKARHSPQRAGRNGE